MSTKSLSKEILSTIKTIESERDAIEGKLDILEKTLTQLGAPTRRGPGRPRGRPKKRGRRKKAAGRRGPGRPPGQRKTKSKAAKKKRKTYKRTPAQRQAIARRMKESWAKRKKAKKK